MELLVLLVIILLLAGLAVSVLGLAIQIAWSLLIGAIIGSIANFVVELFAPGRGGPHGCLATALAGIIGSLLATLVVGRHGFVASIVGAMIVVLLWKTFGLAHHGVR